MAIDNTVANAPSPDDGPTIVLADHPTIAKRLRRHVQPGFPEHLTILDTIGQGGVGRVYLAYDEIIGRRVAMKELLAEFSGTADSEVANSFIHEAKITGKLEHPGIVAVYELGRHADGKPYYVMRYVKGETLEQSLNQCVQSAVAPAFARRLKLLDVLIDVCDAVAYAHAKGVIHRDLKPGNIVCGGFGETIVLDWGLAQVLSDDDNTYFYREALTHQRHTLSDKQTVQVVGTPEYMAPEQFRGEAGKASDVYSLGVILYRIITGELPYRGRLEEIETQIGAHPAVRSPGTLNPSAPPELIAICDKAIRTAPQERFRDAGELAVQLRAFREGGMVNIYSYSTRELLRRFLARHRALVVMAGLLLVAIISGAGFSLHYAAQMEQAKTRAEGALVDLTTYAQRSQEQARAITAAIVGDTAKLFADLNKTKADIAVADDITTRQLLTQLHHRHPHFESFALGTEPEILSALNQDASHNGQLPAMPVALLDNQRILLIYRVPIMKNGTPVSYLEARVYPGQVLPKFVPLVATREAQARNVWIMRQDGLTVYNDRTEYIGQNLFLAPSPSVQAFGRLMQGAAYGIGYYSIVIGDTEFSQIAAWETIDGGTKDSWKVVVNYPYTQKRVVPRTQ
ncbi:serine/threonine-protein kinase [uncultured Thiodictyon sp.]|uniref:serine/threonine-protein kinase n=1 Tax=uncultured Thiodictyon sp. TaxID=1846217 RepID=UPI0025EFE5E4|nr:serine/threonine-protein kinase [uncultured Thiodictyon sp.]